MSPAVRRTILIGAPLALAVLLLFHPQGGERVYEGIRQDATTWLVVHIGLAIGAGMLAVATYTLLDGLSGRAVTIGRVALLAFVVFFIAWEASVRPPRRRSGRRGRARVLRRGSRAGRTGEDGTGAPAVRGPHPGGRGAAPYVIRPVVSTGGGRSRASSTPGGRT